MSYGIAAALQEAVYGALTADTTVATLSGGAIHDALPRVPVPDLYVSLGPEQARDRSDKTGAGALHDFPVTVVTDGAGFHAAKVLAAAISDVLTGANLTLSRGQVVYLRFLRARARQRKDRRDIELWFRAHVDENTS